MLSFQSTLLNYSLRKYEGNQICEWPEVEYSPMPGLPPIRVEATTCALGHEKELESYIGHLVAIYRQVYRVIREDSVCWIVIGDSFATRGGRGESRMVELGRPSIHAKTIPEARGGAPGTKCPNGLKQGDLMLVPHRLALALQADGWMVRNDNVWAKKSPMPESVSGWHWRRHRIKVKKSSRAANLYQSGAGTKQGAGVASRSQREAYFEQGKGATGWTDCPGCEKCEANGGYVLKKGSWRHTRSHEMVLMCTKKMGYWADQEEVREANISLDRPPGNKDRNVKGREWNNGDQRPSLEQSFHPAGRNPRSVLTTDDPDAIWAYLAEYYPDVLETYLEDETNPSDVLTPKPSPLGLKHFAAFSPHLIEPLIKAACPTTCCPVCGTGWSPIITKRRQRIPRYPSNERIRESKMAMGPSWETTDNILGYRPTCGCGMAAYDAVPGVVLDPFGGSGTTALVADRLGLNSVLIEISLDYAKMSKERIEGDAPLLTNVEIVTDIG